MNKLRLLFISISAIKLIGQTEVLPEGESGFILAMNMERAGNIESAKLIYENILKTDPNHQASFFQLKNIYYKKSDSKSAIKLIEKWLISNPGDLQSELALGEWFFRDQQKKKAFKIWENIQLNKLSNEMSYRLLFHTYVKFSQVESMEYLTKKSREKFKNPHFLAIDLANYYQSRQTFDRSLNEYVILMRHQKQYLRYVTDRILLMSDEINTHSLIDSTLKSHAGLIPDIKKILASFYYKTGSFTDALDMHTEIGIEEVDDIKRWMLFSENLRKEGEFNLSIKTYHYLLQNLKTSDPEIIGKVLLGLGESYEDQILKNSKKLEFVKWIPQNIFFKKNYLKSPNIENIPLAETIEHYQSILALLPVSKTTAIANYRLGKIQSTILRDYSGAKKSFEVAIKTSSSNSLRNEINLHMGDLYLYSGMYGKAEKYFKPGLKKNADQKTARYLNSILFQKKIDLVASFLDSSMLKIKYDNQYFNDFFELHDLIANYYLEGTRDDQSAFKSFFYIEGLIQQNKVSEAILGLENLQSNFPNSLIAPLSKLRLAILLIKTNQYKKSLLLALSIIETPLKDKGLALAGEIEEKFLGNNRKALSYYNRLLTECPTSILSEPIRIHARALTKPSES